MEPEQCLDLIPVSDMVGKMESNFDSCGLAMGEVLELRKLPVVCFDLENGIGLRNVVLKGRRGLHDDDIVPQVGISPVEARCTGLGHILDPCRCKMANLEPVIHTADTAGQVDRDQQHCRTACDVDMA